MELHQVKYFVALARSLNFTRAAEQCGVTQPALTKAVLKLEQELGGALVHRERQFTQLTDLGKLVLPMLERALFAADSAQMTAEGFRREQAAPLKLALSPSISAALVVKVLSPVLNMMPDLRVELVEANGVSAIGLLTAGETNAAIVGGDADLGESIDRWPLFEERICVVMAERDPLARFQQLSVEELVKATWIEAIGCELTQKFWRAHFPSGDPPQIRHRGRRLSHLQHMVAAGLGVMLLPEHISLVGGVVRRPIEADLLRRKIELLAPKDRPHSAGLNAFLRAARSADWCIAN